MIYSYSAKNSIEKECIWSAVKAYDSLQRKLIFSKTVKFASLKITWADNSCSDRNNGKRNLKVSRVNSELEEDERENAQHACGSQAKQTLYAHTTCAHRTLHSQAHMHCPLSQSLHIWPEGSSSIW